MKRKYAWIVLAVAAAVVVPLRIYETLVLLEPKTGFYSDGGRASGITAAVLAVLAVLAAVVGYRGGDPLKARQPLKSVPTAVTAALAGALLAFVSAGGLAVPPSGDGAVMYRIFSAAGVAAGAVVLVEAYGFATGLGILEKHPLVALIPSVWGCLGLMVLFVEYSAVVNVAENAYYTCTVIFLLLFLFSQAKLFTGIESEKSGKMIYVAGISAVLLSLSSAVPELVLFAAGETENGFFPVGLHAVNLLLALYIVSFLLSAGRAQGAAEGPLEEPEAAAEPERGAGPEQAETLSGGEEWALPSVSGEERDASPLKPERPVREAAAGDPAGVRYARSVPGSPELLGSGDPSALDVLADFLRETLGGTEQFVECEASPFLRAEEKTGS